MRAGTDCIETIFKFETGTGRGDGILRLIPDAADGNRLKAWTLLTALEELKGFEEQLGVARPRGNAYSRDFRGPNWLDLRKASNAYADRDPTVLVVGGGQSGLSIAARLKQLDVDTLIVDRMQRIGDNWRKRYHALTLHNQVQVNHLPYMLFPPNWPTYIPKDKLANWFEAYVDGHGAELLDRDRIRRRQLRREGRPLDRDAAPRRRQQAHHASAPCRARDRRQRHSEHARHSRPEEFCRQGACIPASMTTARTGRASARIVIGTGNSGHDIAQDLHSSGAEVTLVQRSSTLVVSIEPSAQLVYAPYNEGTLEDNDLIATSMPLQGRAQEPSR